MAEQLNSQKSKVVKGISSQTLITLVIGVMEVVIFSIMSRLLSKEDFGLFAQLQLLRSFLIAFRRLELVQLLFKKKTRIKNM